MLIVSRKINERITVAGKIEITVLKVGRNKVRFGIKAPRDIFGKSGPDHLFPYFPAGK
jgi:carbon storage regulator CsrA